MLFITEGNNNFSCNLKFGNSLFDYINPKGRNCSKYQIEEKYIKHWKFIICDLQITLIRIINLYPNYLIR
jgi:hypothetical protein